VVELTTIIVNYNTAHLLQEVLGRLAAACEGITSKVVVVDNASKDNSLHVLRQSFPHCRVIVNPQNVGFGRANNQALTEAEGPYVLLLNTDAFVSRETIQSTLGYMRSHPRCGILGVKLVGRDGSIQPSARYFPTPWNLFVGRTGLRWLFPHIQMVDDKDWELASIRHCDWVPGCYYLVRRQLIDEIGLFDPRYFLYYEEVDHCYAARRAGWDVVCFPGSTVVHLGGESAASEGELSSTGRQLDKLRIESELLYFRKNHGIVAVCVAAILQSCADVLNVAKRLLRRRVPFGLKESFARLMFVWLTMVRTRFGKRPTR
jgi:N-acetylglucosaminyl-diphospho-decaprenol L-rhamnosyltransferase